MPVVNNITRFLDAKKVKYKAFETPAEKLGALEIMVKDGVIQEIKGDVEG